MWGFFWGGEGVLGLEGKTTMKLGILELDYLRINCNSCKKWIVKKCFFLELVSFPRVSNLVRVRHRSSPNSILAALGSQICKRIVYVLD